MTDDRGQGDRPPPNDSSDDAALEDDAASSDATSDPLSTGGVRIIGAMEASESVSATDDRPVLRFPSPIGSSEPAAVSTGPVWADDPPPVTGEVNIPLVQGDESFELQHYSDPPTGQVPKVVLGDGRHPDQPWASGQPRWRDQDHDQPDFAGFDELTDDKPRLGALGMDDSGPSFFDPELELSGGPSLLAAAAASSEEGSARQPLRRQAKRLTAPRVVDDPTDVDPPSSGGRNMPIAVAVGVGLLSLGLICFKLGTVPTTALIAVVLTLGATEFFATVRRAGYNPATLLGIAAVASFAVAPAARPDIAYPVLVAVTVIATLLWFFWVSPGDGAVMNIGVTLLGIGWIGGLGSLASLLLGQGRLAQDLAKLVDSNATNQGIGVIIAATLVTVSYDVGGFFVGRFMGSTPLSAASPNKTFEGLIGGVAAAVLIPVLILWLGGVHPVGPSLPKAFFFCLFCAIVAPLGDLCQSAIKRDLGVKDMGTLLPAHGGVLDRFDAFLFVLPTAWFMSHLLEIGPF